MKRKIELQPFLSDLIPPVTITRGPALHNYRECERCQLDIALYGESFVNGETDQHYDVDTMIRFAGVANPAVAEAITERLRALRR